MRIVSVSSSNPSATAAIDEVASHINQGLPDGADWLVVFPSVGYDIDEVASTVAARLPGVPTHGATSCLGVMTEAGFCSDQGVGLGAFAISDPDGDYGVAAVEIGDSPEAAAEEAILTAIANAGRHGEPPALVWLSGVPGAEERLIAGIHNTIGSHVPIAGGSSADNTIAGEWRQFDESGTHSNAVVISVLYPSTRVHHSFHSGYLPTDTTGTVTEAHGRRIISIDSRPAGEVYAEWSQGAIDDATPQGGTILAESTMWPLGRKVDDAGDNYVLAHPATLYVDGSMDLFADVAVGDVLTLMQGSPTSLVARAGRVATSALSSGGVTADVIAGALVVYCAGCMLAIQDTMDEVAHEMATALTDAPTLGTFTFGEQGCFIGGDNYHGNLMISVVAFES